MSKNYTDNYFELTEPQKRIFFSETLYKASSIGNLCASYYFEESGNWDALCKAINIVLKNNDGLRLQIKIVNGVPKQYVAKYKEIEFQKKDIIDLKTWINGFSRKVFSFLDTPLYKFEIFYDENSNLAFIMNIHHIISDAWTHDSLSKQIYTYYKLLVSGDDFIIKPQSSYLDFIDIEKEYIGSKRFEKSKAFWDDEKVSTYTVPNFNQNNLPKKSKANRLEFLFNKSISNKIDKYCIDHSISVPNFLFAVLYIVANDYSKSNKILLGTLTHNRIGKKEKQIAGMYVNTLPVCMDIDQSVSFNDFSSRLNLKMAGIMRHQRFPLSAIDDCPDLTLVYTYENIEPPIKINLHFSGEEFFPMVFRPSMRAKDGIYKVEIDYQKNLFNDNDIIDFFNRYDECLNWILNNEGQSIESFYNKDLAETINKNKVKQNETYNYNVCLHNVFEERAIEFAERIAVTCDGAKINYYDLNKKANYLANQIISSDLELESPVVLLMERSIDMMISILAVLKAGCCYLPLSPEQPINRSKKIIDLSGAGLVLYNHDIGMSLEHKTAKIDVRKVIYPAKDIPNPNIPVKPDNLAYIIYTSGSTGEPKGVMVEHRSVINRLYWMQRDYSLNSNDVVMQKTPYTFDVSVWELFSWYLAGSTLHFLTPGAEKEPQTITEVIKREKVTIIHFVPSMLSLFLEYMDGYGDVDDIKTLRRVNCSGEALLLDQVNRFKKVINRDNSVDLYNLYGPTEATVEVTMMDCLNNKHGFIPIGKPIENVELYVLDQDGNVLPAGAEGELFIGGVCLARGYFKRDDLTADKFVFNEGLGKRLYSSGDLATYLEDGNIKYLGRIDNQVKIRGNRVELEEIENLILSYEGISEAAVTAPVDDYGNTYLGAYLVADSVIGHEDLRHYIQDQLPSYMVPSFFLQMEEFPLTSSGKLDRKALVVPFNNKDKDKKYRAPVNDREEEICEIWEDVLKRDKISIDDNFFEIGGDSLNLIQVLFPLQEKYDLSLQDLFEYPTIESLSKHIHRRTDNGLSFDEDAYKRISKQWKCNNKIGNYMAGIPGQYDLKKVKHERILITGATGFLGIYLTREYLEHSDCEIVLMVRADSIDSAYERVLEKFNYYFDQELLFDNDDRISVVPGDISFDYFGQLDSIYSRLAKSVDAVIHCAANVKHFGERERIYQSNVMGTKRILDFCKEGREKFIYLVSTTSIGLNSLDDDIVFHFTEDDVMSTNGTGNVYIDSKILAEDLVRSFLESGKGQILRVGNIVTDLENGQFQENNDENAFHNLMQDYRNRGIIPDIDIPFIDLTWVNELARAMFLLTNTDYKGVLHLFNPHRVTLKKLFEQQDMKLVSMGTFLSELKRNDPILTHGYYLGDVKLLGVIPYSERTLRLLDGLNFNWSPISESEIGKLWESYTKYAVLV